MSFLVVLFLLCGLVGDAQDKPSIIILTDIGGDPDDQQSLVRFLLYSDKFDVKAICATSRMTHGQDVRTDIVRGHIKAYSQVYSNLLKHSPDYPSPDYLFSIIKSGQEDETKFGKGYDSQASDAIIKLVDEAEDIIHIAIWGGQRELAQALWKVNENRSKEEVTAFCNKIQVMAIGDQDDHRDWIVKNFTAIRYIASGFIRNNEPWGVRQASAWRGMYMTGDQSMQKAEWVKQNIHGHGPLGKCYPLHGASTNGMKEGDTPSFLGLITNGLNSPENPQWGGWGGRYRKLKGNLFIDALDFLNGVSNERHTVSRWRPTFQKDFMARMDWCVQSYENANHNPQVVVNNSSGYTPIWINAQNGEKLRFDASGSADPDGDALSYHWFIYNEISPGGQCAEMHVSAGGEKCIFKVPDTIPVGRNIHLILEITDDGTPALTTYKRMVIRVSPN